jgi:O-antigen/teichoic acid export membrane protein
MTTPVRVVSRAGWGFADQALSSLTNFVLTLLVARSVSATDLGAFSLAFGSYLIALNVGRQLAMQPLLIRYSGAPEVVWRSAAARAVGLGLWIGIVGGLLCGAVGLVVPGSAAADFLVLAPLLPGLIVQDCWRMAFFTAERGRSAFTNDLAWAVLLVPALGMVFAAGFDNAPALVAAWGVSGSLAAVFGVGQARAWPNLRAGLAWLLEHRRLSLPLTIESVTGVVSQQVASLGVALVASLAVVGALRAAQLFIGPLLVLSQGLSLIAIPEGTRLLRRSRQTLWRGCLFYAAALFALYIVWGLVASALPTALGVALLRSNWLIAQPAVFPLALAIGAGSAGGALGMGLRVLAEGRRMLVGGATSSLLSATGQVAGAAAGGAVGAALGSACGNVMGGAVMLRQLHVAASGVALRATLVDSLPPPPAPI